MKEKSPPGCAGCAVEDPKRLIVEVALRRCCVACRRERGEREGQQEIRVRV